MKYGLLFILPTIVLHSPISGEGGKTLLNSGVTRSFIEAV
jgi:hypothetical protein